MHTLPQLKLKAVNMKILVTQVLHALLTLGFSKLKAALLRVYLRSRLSGKSFVSNIKATQVQHTPVPSYTNGQKKLKLITNARNL